MCVYSVCYCALAGGFISWLSWYIPSVILLINNLVYIIFTTNIYRVGKAMTLFVFQHKAQKRYGQSTTENIRAGGSTQINAKLLFRTRTVVLPFSNSCKIGMIRVFQKVSSTSSSGSCSCKLALEAAKRRREGERIVRRDQNTAHTETCASLKSVNHRIRSRQSPL